MSFIGLVLLILMRILNGQSSDTDQYCVTDFTRIQIPVDTPYILKCNGKKVIWVSYQIHVVDVNTGANTWLNNRFSVVLSSGDHCTNIPKNISVAPQADCHNVCNCFYSRTNPITVVYRINV